MAEQLPLDILYEDAALLVVNKPAGMVAYSATGYSDGTLLNALAWHLKDAPEYRRFAASALAACPRQALHARTLGFAHPQTGEQMDFEAPLPPDMGNLSGMWWLVIGNHRNETGPSLETQSRPGRVSY